jgi:hypothetical protein
MTTIETQRDQLKAYEEYIESIKFKFDTAKKIEFKRRETAYYAAQRAKKILEGDCSEIEKQLDKLVKEQKIFYVVFFLLIFSSSFLTLPILLLLAVGLAITFTYLKSRITQFRILHVTTLHQILFYDTETNKALSSGYLRYKDEADAIERDESFRNSLESEEITLIQDLYEKEIQVAIINEMAE